MAITSWTSEGMDWTSADTLKLCPLAHCLEAVRLAAAERMIAADTLNFGGTYAILTEDHNPMRNVKEITDAVDDLMFGWEFLESFLKQDQVDALPSATRPAYWTEATLLTAIGDVSRETIATFGGNLADWLIQRYKILNKLRTIAVYGWFVDNKAYSLTSSTQRKQWGRGSHDWSASTWDNYVQTRRNVDWAQRVRQSMTVGFRSQVSSLSKNIVMGARIGKSFYGDDAFSACDNTDIDGSALSYLTYCVLRESGASTGTSISSGYYNNIDIDPGRAASNEGWAAGGEAKGRTFLWADVSFAFRDW